MKSSLLRVYPNGELTTPVTVLLFVVGFAISIISIYCVQQALPHDAWLAKAALAILGIASGPGLSAIFAVFIKIFQGGRAEVVKN